MWTNNSTKKSNHIDLISNYFISRSLQLTVLAVFIIFLYYFMTYKQKKQFPIYCNMWTQGTDIAPCNRWAYVLHLISFSSHVEAFTESFYYQPIVSMLINGKLETVQFIFHQITPRALLTTWLWTSLTTSVCLGSGAEAFAQLVVAEIKIRIHKGFRQRNSKTPSYLTAPNWVCKRAGYTKIAHEYAILWISERSWE